MFSPSSTRDMSRPIQSLGNTVGANHVRWSRHNNNILATGHEGDVKVWDVRSAASPLVVISAHIARLHSIDWSYRYRLLSSDWSSLSAN